MEQALYDQIGRQYTSTRRPDPRIAAAILDALGDADSVVNVGAGAGAYEPPGRSLVAVEPSWQMIRQRSAGASGVVQASAEALIVQASADAVIVQATAEALPFRAGTFDAALAVLTLHHWVDWRCGLGEMQRVADRLVIFTIEPRELGNFWLTESYFPEIVRLDQGRCPSVDDIVEHLGNCSVDHIAVPHDCVDGFLAAFWRRPEAYLDPKVRAGMSGFALLDQDAVDRGVTHLKSDLESGEWARRFGHIMSLDALDVCYRLLVTAPPRRQ
jgi:SAM-dependent methyltransferase